MINYLVNLWLCIIAGGNGTRLFLYSNKDRPKQFCLLDKDHTFIQSTIERFMSFGIDPKHIVIIVTNDVQWDLAKEQTMERYGVLSSNIVKISPDHGYAGAMVVATNHVYGSDPNAVVISTPSDQSVETNKNFYRVINAAIENVSNNPDHVVFVGKPITDDSIVKDLGVFTYKETSETVVAMEEFYEKPQGATLQKVLRGKYACNTGISVWNSAIFRPCLEMESREIATDELIRELRARLNIDIVVGDFHWDDCGTFKALYRVNSYSSGSEVVVLGNAENVVYENCRQSLLITDSSLEINVYGASDVAVIAREIEGHYYLEVAAFNYNQGVAEAAKIFEENLAAFRAGITLGGRNNGLTTPREDIYHCCFIGVSNYKVHTYERKSGKRGFQVTFGC
ncbi:MAG: hypothetical protein K6G36_00030 [Candidatus Saccharibacteria bacterium]|nr:hypothetical protein [Candidatus Saccharibacteria bacterium]